MRIRLVMPHELSRLQDIEHAAGQAFCQIGMPQIAEDEPLPLADLERYRVARRAWVVAVEFDQPAAYLIADIVDRNLHIEQVSVHPDYSRRGIGRMLIEYLACYGSEAGIPALTLTTFTNVPWNGPYYQGCGFRTIPDADIGPELRAIQEREAAHGLCRWPRVCMRRALSPLHEPS